MQNRRRFLEVVGGSAVMLLGCSSNSSGGNAAAGGAAGQAGEGGAAGSSGAAGAGGSGGSGGSCAVNAGSQGYNADFCQSPAGKFDVGLPSDYQSEGLFKVQNQSASVVIGRDANGLWAMSSLCTHQCCDMNSTIQGQQVGTITTYNGQAIIRCNCHGSRFGLDGSVVSGPAYIKLANYALTLECDGHLYVDTTAAVDPSTRLAV